MKRDTLKELYAEEYDYLEFIKDSTRINQTGLHGLEEGRTKRHKKLLGKYGYQVAKNERMYRRSKTLMDNLDVMIDLELEKKVTGEECRKLADWLGSREFKDYMEEKEDVLHFKGYVYG